MNTEQEETFRVLNEALGAIHDMENRITALLKTMASETTIRDRRFQRGIQSARVALKVAKYRDKILALHAEGLCNTDIANQIGLHRSTTRLYTRILGLEPNPRPTRETLPRDRPKLPSLHEQNETLKQNPRGTTNDS